MRKPTALKVAIVASGIPQQQIAAEIGLNEATLSRIVNGLHAKQSDREAIARVLRLSVDELFPTTLSEERAA